MIVFPNAKINIGLHIIEKRKDGFHNIESIFYPVFNLYDVLEVVESDTLSFTSSGISIPGKPLDNLCVKAFELLQQDFDLPFVKIHLHKVIPIGAGLGGGSANAAFLLKALNTLFQLQLSTAQLIEYAQKLGSDCAFFIDNKPSFAFGKGDELEAIDLDLSAFRIEIKYPAIHISTATAYRGIVPQPSPHSLKEMIAKPIHQWKEWISNDFEKTILPTHPTIAQLKNELYQQGAIYTAMTGSGSAVFGVFGRG